MKNIRTCIAALSTAVFILGMACSGLSVFAAARPNAAALLMAAEKIRVPQVDYQVQIRLTDQKKGGREVRTYEADIKGRNRARVRFLTPEIDHGTKVLFVDNDMWVYLPSTAKPVRVSPRQRLVGNAVYGDIVRLNFVDNYQAKFLRQDKFQGRKSFVLDLTAIAGRPITYDRIEYWIDAATKSPLKALYQTAEGRVLREGYFDHFQPVFGVRRPGHLRLVDHLQPDHVTILVFSGEKKASFPDLLFERENFARD